MPTRKKKGKAKKAGTSKAKGALSSFDTRPVKLERDLTSSDYPTSTSSEGLEVGEEIFFDATDIQPKVCAPALAPSGNMTESKGQRSWSRVAEIGQDPQKTRTLNFPKYFSRATRYSVGVQTVPLKKNDRGIDNQVETLQWGVITDPDTETETTHLEKSSSGEEDYEDARENVTDDAPWRQKAGWEYVRSGVKNRDCRDQMVQVPCPKDQTRQQKDSDLASRIDTDDHENHTRQKGEKGYPDSPCCSCLLTVLYWLALLLFVSLLLSLFFTIFLLFSRNHGLGIGPGLLYSDVEHIRNQIDPYLDLRHKASPPT